MGTTVWFGLAILAGIGAAVAAVLSPRPSPGTDEGDRRPNFLPVALAILAVIFLFFGCLALIAHIAITDTGGGAGD